MAFDEKVDHDSAAITTIYDASTHQQCSVWGVKHNQITVKNNQVATTARWAGYVEWIFGKNLISCKEDEGIRARWEFSMDHYVTGGYYLELGIASDPNGFINAGQINYMSTNIPGNYYCVWTHQGKTYSHLKKGSLSGKNWKNKSQSKTGDKIAMELNGEKKTLSFWKNNEFMGITHSNIDFDTVDGYYLAVGLSNPNNKVSITKYMISGTDVPNMVQDLTRIQGNYIQAIKKGEQMLDLFCKNDDSKNNTNDDNNQDKGMTFDKILKLSEDICQYDELISKIELQHKQLCQILKQVTKYHDNIFKPDILKYKEWKLNDIIFWIMSLENGRFKKYCKNLKILFKENEITGKDLPFVSRQDLDVSFKIKVFRDRMDLEKHFQKLDSQNVN